jgi:hypothetical protein
MPLAWKLVFGMNTLFILIALILEPNVLVNIMNASLFAIAVGVCTAYSPIIWYMIWSNNTKLDSSDWLGLGIFTNWTAIIGIRLWSLAWRWAGRPDDWGDDTVLSYMLFLSCCGGVFHLVATQAVGGRAPKRSWLIVGAWVSGVVFVTLLLNMAVTGNLNP